MPSANFYNFGLAAVTIVIMMLPGSSADDIVCEKGTVFEIKTKTYLHERRPEYMLVMYYQEKDDAMTKILTDVSNNHADLYAKKNYFCVAQYDCKANPVKYDFCDKIKRSEVFMFKSYEENGLHHVGEYTVEGITEFIKDCQSPEAWRITGEPGAARGLDGPAKGLGILVLVFYISIWFPLF
ncbi:hypothetical protein KR074_008119 [Drosophila pseudoananassae]|nr:hypothetical protein KR074_008119 [Drosophila pseudoananassae]